MRIYFVFVQTLEANNVFPPLGTMYVAAAVRAAGHDVKLLDVDPNVFDVVKKVRDYSPDVVGLSFMTPEYEKARVLSFQLKKALPKTILCCGGVHPTADPESVLRSFDVDFCIKGEGDVSFVEVCKRIDSSFPYDNVAGVCLLKNQQFIANRNPPPVDVDTLPLPARDLINFDKIYLTFPGVVRGRYVKSTIVMAGRGCLYNCSFCAVKLMFGNRYSLRQPESVIQEVVHLQKTYGVKGIRFQDSTFTSDRKWTMKFCEEVLRRNVKFVWTCDTRANCVDEGLLAMMKKAGCIQVDYGLESGSPRLLKSFSKGVKPAVAVAAVEMTRKAGIRVGASFIIANIDEEEEDLEQTFGFAKKVNADYSVFHFLVPYPGTKIREIALEKGLIKENDPPYGPQFGFRSVEYPMITHKLSVETLQAYRSKMQNYFFLRNYLGSQNLIIYFHLFWLILKNPRIAWKSMKKAASEKRLDSFIESILIPYRKSLYKYY